MWTPFVNAYPSKKGRFDNGRGAFEALWNQRIYAMLLTFCTCVLLSISKLRTHTLWSEKRRRAFPYGSPRDAIPFFTFPQHSVWKDTLSLFLLLARCVSVMRSVWNEPPPTISSPSPCLSQGILCLCCLFAMLECWWRSLPDVFLYLYLCTINCLPFRLSRSIREQHAVLVTVTNVSRFHRIHLI